VTQARGIALALVAIAAAGAAALAIAPPAARELAPAGPGEEASVPPACAGVWSATGQWLAETAPGAVVSPDRRTRLRIVEDANEVAALLERAGRARRVDAFVDPALTEVVWSPDGRRVALNVSDGGLVGTWDAVVLRLDDGDAPARPVLDTDAVRARVHDLPHCDGDEVANLGVVGFTGPDQLLLAAEVPPHSSCRNLGEVRLLRVDLADGRMRVLAADDAARALAEAGGCRVR
jgi:hypothetical protein